MEASSPRDNVEDALQVLGQIRTHMDQCLEQLRQHIQEAEHIDDQAAAKQWDAWIATAQIRGGKLLHRWTKASQNNSGHTMSVGQQGPLSLEEVLDTVERLCEL